MFELTQLRKILDVQSCGYYLTWNKKPTISAACTIVGFFLVLSFFSYLSLCLIFLQSKKLYLNWQMCVINILIQKWFILFIHYSEKRWPKYHRKALVFSIQTKKVAKVSPGKLISFCTNKSK